MKTILITGATSGLGFATAKALLGLGHHVLIHGRDEGKLGLVRQELAGYGGQLSCFTADLSDDASIRAMLKQILAEHRQIDVLINNAGVFKSSTSQSSLGLDIRFMVNTIAPYLIAQELSPQMQYGRVINLTSAAQSPFSVQSLTHKDMYQDPMQAYAESKLALTCWTFALALKSNESQVEYIAVNPGSLLATPMVQTGFGIQGRDISLAVSTLVDLATSCAYRGISGLYFDGDNGRFTQPHPMAVDIELQQQLLETLELLTQVS